MKKIVKNLEWSSCDGVVEFRPVYEDGSVGAWTPADFETSDPCYQQKVARIAMEQIGQEA